MYKILVSDPIAKDGLQTLLDDEQFEVDIDTSLSPDELIEKIKAYDGLIVRSQTQVTEDVIEAADNLKIIARAGVGVDNINKDAATKRGVLVINAPDGNTISATEHSMAMILAMARQIPMAHQSLKEGKWNRSEFKGTELYHKTLGVIGTGRIGLGVAKRAKSFGMKIIAFDPYLTAEKAQELDIQRASVEEIAQKADFVTVHTPLTAKTKGMIGKEFFEQAKPQLQIINVARGGIIDEEELVEALDKGLIARAAIDVFTHEPATDSPLVKHNKVIVTPHLGASTVEAQEKVAVSVSNEIAEFFHTGNVRHAINAPKMIFGEEDKELQDYIDLCDMAGKVCIQLLGKAPRELKIKFSGQLVKEDTNILTRTIAKGVLSQDLGDRVNLVNSLFLLNEQNVVYNVEKDAKSRSFNNYIELTMINRDQVVTVGATVLNGYGPRIVRINDYPVDFKPAKYQLIINHTDRPGIVGRTGQILGEYDINIASMHLGRAEEGGDAMMIISVDHTVSEDIIKALFQIDGFKNIQFVDLSK